MLHTSATAIDGNGADQRTVESHIVPAIVGGHSMLIAEDFKLCFLGAPTTVHTLHTSTADRQLGQAVLQSREQR